jgi:hypothetical protein
MHHYVDAGGRCHCRQTKGQLSIYHAGNSSSGETTPICWPFRW